MARSIVPEDWSGRAFLSTLPLERRRRFGAVYTPPRIVEMMLGWARGYGEPSRIIDPGAGSGRFILAAAKVFPKTELIAVEVDRDAADILTAHVQSAGLSRRIRVVVDDFRRLELPPIDGKTLFIGNPHYVRHHDIEPEWKAWYAATANRFGVTASRLAGLHLHFLLKVRELARPGDFGALITSAEWLEVNYGAMLRKLLLNGMGGVSIDVFPEAEAVFDDALTTAAITCFEIGASAEGIAFNVLKSAGAQLGSGELVDSGVLSQARSWGAFAGGSANGPSLQHKSTVGDYFRVSRGQVTGGNSVWIVRDETPPLPSKFLVPTVTRAKELIESSDGLHDDGSLKRVVSLPRDLSGLSRAERAAVETFLAWAREHGADKSYIARHRMAWWSVGMYPPAPILCTYMGRRPPVFVRNYCGAKHINIAHGLYPQIALSDAELGAVTRWLNGNVARRAGRTYAGGLTKFEPREIERLRIPSLDELESL